jgi:biopolymer transport protein ExbB
MKIYMKALLRVAAATLAIFVFFDAAVLAGDSLAQTSSASNAAAVTSPSVRVENLPRDLSPRNMFLSADAIVKGVMVGLVLASMMTWTVGLAKGLELISKRRALRKSLQSISNATSLSDAMARLSGRPNTLNALADAAARELHLSRGMIERQGIKERVQSHLDRIELSAGRNMNRGTGILATIGSTAPFIGLFGTVWGIMNSFIGISHAQTTNLAVVAPGIAEALLATAFGLVAAIPAVFIYNQFARALASYKALVGDASAEVMRLVSRDLDFGAASLRYSPQAAE